VMGVILKQGNMIQRELWALQSGLLVRPSDARNSTAGDEDLRPAPPPQH
jgi:hypothetical protein